MESNLFKNKGTRGFSLIVTGWPLIILCAGLLIWGIYSIDLYLLNSSIVVPFGLLPLRVMFGLVFVSLGVFHFILCRKWNREFSRGEMGERLFFIKAEYFGVIPFGAGLYGLCSILFV